MSDARKPLRDGDASATPASISGIEAMRGVGSARAKGFWADAWDRIVARIGVRVALAWIGSIAFFAVFAPVLASAHPLLRSNTATGTWDSPLWQNLTSVDFVLLAGAVFGVPFVFMPASLASRLGVAQRSTRLVLMLLIGMQAGITVVVCGAISAWARDIDSATWIRELSRVAAFPWIAASVVSAVMAAVALLLAGRQSTRVALIALAAVIAVSSSASRWTDRLVNFDAYDDQEASGEFSMIYTLVPFSPDFGRSDLYVLEPMTKISQAIPQTAGRPIGERTVLLGSDAIGKDVLSQMMWACRLSISIGLVSTGLIYYSLLIWSTVLKKFFEVEGFITGLVYFKEV